MGYGTASYTTPRTRTDFGAEQSDPSKIDESVASSAQQTQATMPTSLDSWSTNDLYTIDGNVTSKSLYAIRATQESIATFGTLPPSWHSALW